MLIQSPVASANDVYDAMRTFMVTVPGDLDEEQFARHKAALLSDIQRPDKNLWERADFYWQSIATKQFEFDGRQQIAAAVAAFTLEDWQSYYQRVFLDQPHSLQVVAPGRWDSVPEGDFLEYDSAAEIKRDNDYYLVQ